MSKDSFVSSQMVLGSLLTVFLLISGCSVVPKSDRAQHEQCVYFSLDNLFLGEKCDWYSANGSTMGQVKVVAHRQQQSGYCTTLYNSVFHANNWVNWQEVACKQSNGQWRFVSR